MRFGRDWHKQRTSKWFRLNTEPGDLVSLALLPRTLTVLYDSQDIDFVRTMVNGIPESATAVAVESDDGEYIQVWFSESRAPFFDSAIYERIL